ncbi:DinB family protein [Ohtaekwangia sp.]|uniref:DinB family protein n=1 Tax=Ohtaekwangia sp. TaxID=2066019 RepID=UPI002F94F0A2
MNQEQLIVTMAMQAWETQIKRADQLFNALSDEQLLQEIAPGKNRVIYLVGHLAAVNDGINSILGLGERQYAHYDAIFLSSPDKAKEAPSVQEVRDAWTTTIKTLTERFSKVSTADWFTRHLRMTDEDFQKEPYRNKLSVLLNRTSHVAYHLGQVVLVKSR